MAAAAAADEPAAKLVKQEQQDKQDYTMTHRPQFNLFMQKMTTSSQMLFLPRVVIDGLEVERKIYKGSSNTLMLDIIATKDCANGLMFPKHCGHNAYEFFKHHISASDENGVFDYIKAFNKLMFFMDNTMPHLKIYDNMLRYPNDYEMKMAMEVVGPRGRHSCIGCGQILCGTLRWIDAAHLYSACLKCHLKKGTTFRPGQPYYHQLDYDDNKYEFDRLGSRKKGIFEYGVIGYDMYECGCDEDYDDDGEEEENESEEEEEDIAVGISVEVLDQQHPVFMYQNQEEAASCSVCMEVFKKDDACRVMACAHTFHKQCIDTWLEDHAKCPLCRAVCDTGAAA